MWQIVRQHPVAIFAAIFAHAVFFAVLFVSFNFTDDTPQGMGEEKIEVIEATAVDERQIQAELDKLKAADKKKKDAVKKARQERIKEQKRLADLKKQRKAEEKKRKQRAAAEKKRLAELEKKRKKAELERQKEEQRLAELEKKRKKEEDRLRQEEFSKKLEAERLARESAAKSKARQSEISRYKSLINNSVERFWNVPAAATKDMRCVVRVKLIPSGEVLDVKVIKSSGNPAYDKSVENAIFRASPLPVPSIESGLFNEFREVELGFSPENRV